MIAESHVQEAPLACLKELVHSVTGGPYNGIDSHKLGPASHDDSSLTALTKEKQMSEAA
jgi:hypothetical protein